jgi:hypothetical protein
MPDTKLSALTALAVAPDTDDEIYIRDISEAAADESKRILISTLFTSPTLVTPALGTPSSGTLTNTTGLPVAGIVNGTARQLIQTNAGATAAEWASNIDIPGTLDVTGIAVFDAGIYDRADSQGLRLGADDDHRLFFNGTEGVYTTNGVGSLTILDLGTVATPSINNTTVLTVQRSGGTTQSCEVAIVSGNAASSLLSFGDTDDADAGRIGYSHITDSFDFRIQGSVRIILSAAEWSFQQGENITTTDSLTMTPATNFIVSLAATDKSAVFGGAIVDGAALTFNNVSTRTAITSRGHQLHVPAQTTNFDNASSTIAIGANFFYGIPTFTGDTATLTMTDAATVYIAGAPVASTNVAFTNTAKALWVAAGQSVFGGGIYDRADSQGVYLGAGDDSRLYYDGTDTFWNLQAAGSGGLTIGLAAGFPNPDNNRVHIWGGSAGTVSGDPSALLILENPANVYLHFLSGNSAGNRAGFVFGDTDANFVAYFRYDHLNDRLEIGSGGALRLLYKAALFAFQEATVISTTTGDLTLSPTSNIATARPFASSSSIKSSSSSLGIGYSTGAGGMVTQATNKSTGVTINTITGAITMNGAALNAGTSVSFTVTNSSVEGTDAVMIHVSSGATSGTYITQVTNVAAGSFRVHVRNVSGGSQSEAIVLRYAIIKSVSA